MPAAINRTMTAGEWALLICLGILWGGSYFYVAVAVKALPPFTIVALRVLIGAALLILVVRITGARMPTDGKTWSGFVVMGLINNVVPFSLIAWGQGHIASGLAAILNATTPLFGVLVAHLLTHDERMTLARVGGVVVGFAGVVVMIGPDAIAGAGNSLLAEFACLAAALFYAFSGVYGRRFGQAGLPPMVTAAGQIAASAAMMTPLALVVDRPWNLAMPSVGVWAAMLGLGAVSTCLAYIIYYRILKTAGAINLLLVTFLVPVSAILLGALILGEHLAFRHFAGMAAIGVGLAAIDGRLPRLMRREAAAHRT